MFFNDLSSLPALAEQTNFAIFAADPAKAKTTLQRAYKTRAIFLEPDAKTGKISTDDVRTFITATGAKDPSSRFFVILQADTLTPAAENALLKSLEEPRPHHHFILLTLTTSALLLTVLSRAQVFYLRQPSPLAQPPAASEKVKTLAKQLIVATPEQLLTLAADLAKHKDNPRGYATEVVGAAIEILYKSYFATSEPKFLKKLPRLLKLYDAFQKNGHIKLHIVADML